MLPLCAMLIETLVDTLSLSGIHAPQGTFKTPQGMFKIQKRLMTQSCVLSLKKK